ncbi:hypothetical protein CTAYLR_003141 [Chrysophaeum taylorii]|uniref:MYND-type domain-containing protein n=1 Tax=Chrysophaeum taylorii TaxID=2483200 RepID=A0AAD7UQ51_9STRA|nr:hypothetical protein CTAYLR_003141 [Chrysophaeum taylorii]
MKACVVCGAMTRKRCGRCSAWSFCSIECQKAEWPRHKEACRIEAAIAGCLRRFEPKRSMGQCWVCLEETSSHGGCSCRGDAGWVHVACATRVARTSPGALPGGMDSEAWLVCKTCKQLYAGGLELALCAQMWRECCGDEVKEAYASASLAARLRSHGCLREALGLSRKSRQVFSRTFGANHERTHMATVALASLLAGAGNAREACALYRGAPVGGIPGIEARIQYADCLRTLGETIEAEKVGREALGESERCLGQDHDLTLAAESSLAATLAPSEESEALFEDALARRRRVFGPDHQETLAVARNFATSLATAAAGKGRGIALLRDTYRRSQRTHGANHPRTLDLAAVLARLEIS